jgi:hypothetical protein
VLFVARKELGPPPYFEEVGHLVMANDPLLDDPALQHLLEQAHRVLGVDDAITHTEVRFTNRGPRIVEINGRLGGDLIPYLGWMTSGIDPGTVAVQIASGINPGQVAAKAQPVAPPPGQPRRPRCAGIRFCHPPEDCRVLSVRLPGPDPALGIVESDIVCSPGAELRLPPTGWLYRYAFVVCEADDQDTLRARLDHAAARVELEWHPLTAATT